MLIQPRNIRFFGACIAVAMSAACTINPVTGERQLALVSADEEISIGQQQYLPSQQMQGGAYLRDPALTAYVRTVGNRLAAVSDRALPYEFVVLNNSVPNAWALPGGKIAINRGLLVELGSEAELAAVLGHEIVHAAARHGALAMQRGLILQGAVIAASVATRRSEYSDLAVGAAGLGANLINMRHGRDAELESDAYGIRYMSRAGYDVQAAVDLQQTFVRLSEGRDDAGWLNGLFSSHPPSAERVSANRATAATFPGGGNAGRAAFLDATASLRRDAPGYAALDRGRSALGAGDIQTARREAASALEQIPDEALVETLLGDIEMANAMPALAATHYANALALNDNFFLIHLGSGDANRALERMAQAESAYNASNALLPTARAFFGLGRIAEARGNIALALEHYGRAADSSGNAGRDARAAIVRLDLPDNPERYLATTGNLDQNANLILQITNTTELPVADIQLTISYRQNEQVSAATRTLSNVLGPGQTQRFTTGLGPFSSTADFQITLGSARVVTSE